MRSHMQRIFRLPQIPEPQARCAPWHPCMQKVMCLRFRAAPEPGVPLCDYSKKLGDPLCDSFLPLPNNEMAP